MSYLLNQLPKYIRFRQTVPYALLLFFFCTIASILMAFYEPFSTHLRFWMVALPLTTGVLPTFGLFHIWRQWTLRLLHVAVATNDSQALPAQVSLLSCHENIGVPPNLHMELRTRIAETLAVRGDAALDEAVSNALVAEAIFICSRYSGVCEAEMNYCRAVFAEVPATRPTQQLHLLIRLAKRKPANEAQRQMGAMVHAVLLKWGEIMARSAGDRELLRPATDENNQLLLPANSKASGSPPDAELLRSYSGTNANAEEESLRTGGHKS